MFRAQLVGIYTVGEMPEQLLPFLNLQAKRERKELKMGERAAVFQIEGTASFVVAFLSTLRSVEEMESRLKEQDAILDPVSKRSLDRVMQERR
ncbi:MAG: DUF749 family protein [Methanomassiliicoccales archaeon]|jgi:hypothetical protein|nr:DUF749 family protein [Methanomassiliicoccales archaeon]